MMFNTSNKGKCSMSRFISILILLLSITATSSYSGKITSAGLRTSRYGISPYPEPIGFHHTQYTMIGYFPKAAPVMIWTTGVIWDPGECHLYFPNDDNYPTDNISYSNEDLNEDYLTYFDSVGIKVFLQIEPGDADMETLIDIVFGRYKNHSSVIGFGVDVEWYECADNEWGKKVDDATAKEWEDMVKTHKDSYQLFLKHPDRTPSRFPKTYRGDIIFVNDCEGLTSKNSPDTGFVDYENDFLGVMKTFADTFYPNTIFFQIGYPSSADLWNDFDPKPKVMGDDLEKTCQTDQELGIFWVDFGMNGVLPHDNNWEPLDWPTKIKVFNNSKTVSNKFIFKPNKKYDLSIFSLDGKMLKQTHDFGYKIEKYIMNTNSITTGTFILKIENGKDSYRAKKMFYR